MSKFRQFRHGTLALLVTAGAGLLMTVGLVGCGNRTAEPGTPGAKIKLITREVSLSKIDSGIIVETLAVSPDSKRVAYGARHGDKLLVIVDGTEGKPYDGIGNGTLTFSPDSKRVAYAARRGDKWLVVVDGAEGKAYDVFLRGSRLVFDDTRSLHSLVIRDNKFFRVEIRIVE